MSKERQDIWRRLLYLLLYFSSVRVEKPFNKNTTYNFDFEINHETECVVDTDIDCIKNNIQIGKFKSAILKHY